MKSFDAPSREECTAERPRSNTPLAALVLLNDPTYVEAARVFAEHAINTKEGTSERIEWLIRNSLFRHGTEQEKNVLSKLLLKQHEYYREHHDEAKQLVEIGLTPPDATLDAAETAAWTSIARTLFNMHEFTNRN